MSPKPSQLAQRLGWPAPSYRPGRDRRAVRHPAPTVTPTTRATGTAGTRRVLVAGGGIAGIAAACGLAERGVAVTLVEPHAQLGGRVRSWPITLPDGSTGSMSRGFHAFFRQYYNLRALLRRIDPELSVLAPVADYPLMLADRYTDSFARIPTTPPWNLAAFVARSPSFPLASLRTVAVPEALGLLDVHFPDIYEQLDGVSATEVLDRLRFPAEARHLALEVFARSFFAHPDDFSGAELVAMFHMYFTGSAEGLLFDVPVDDYDTVLWQPMRRYLAGLGVDVLTDTSVLAVRRDGAGFEVSLGPAGGESGTLSSDAVVLATDLPALQRVLDRSPDLGDEAWRTGIAALRTSPPFVVWRLWLDRYAAPDRAPFLGTSGFGPLDNISLVERMEGRAASWSAAHAGSIVELHAYAVSADWSPESLQGRLRAELDRAYPELAGAGVVHDEWLWQQDCPLPSTAPWRLRPTVATPVPGLVLAGDAIRCDYPVALMERATTTGLLAANTLLGEWGLAGHELWTVPMGSRLGPWPGRLRRAWPQRGSSSTTRATAATGAPAAASQPEP